MNHPSDESIEKKLTHLPKPKMNQEMKNNIYFELMRDELYKKDKHLFFTKKLVYPIVGVLVLFIFSMTMVNSMLQSNHHPKTNSFSLSIDHKKKVDMKKLLPYRESYVGDNSAVVKILHQLPGGQDMNGGVSLSTKKEPYGINVNYHSSNAKYWSNENTERIFLYNATTLFILIRNVDEVSFNIKTKEGTQSFQATRADLEEFYGVKLRELSKDQAQWENLLNHTFTDKEKVKSFYDQQVFKHVNWTLSPSFQSDDHTKMIGKKGKLGIMESDFTSKQTGKYLWGFWGDKNELQGPVKIVAMKKDSGNVTKIFSTNGLMGSIYGADQHIPSNMYFPSPGVWCLYVYLNDKPFDYIVIKVN